MPSRGTATRMPTCELNCFGSSRGPVCRPGQSSFRTSAAPGRRNSQPIAAKHYLQVTDDHFSKAVRNPVQQPAVLPRTGSQAGLVAQEKTPVLQGSATGCEAVHPGRVPKRGLEQSADSPRRVQVSETAGAKSGAVDRENGPIDPDLAQVIETWPTLPPAIREAILAMLRAAE